MDHRNPNALPLAVIGASAGAIEAIGTVLSALPEHFQAGTFSLTLTIHCHYPTERRFTVHAPP